jgi:hypothetical protein
MGLNRQELQRRKYEQQRKAKEYNLRMVEKRKKEQQEIDAMAMLLDAKWTGTHFVKEYIDPSPLRSLHYYYYNREGYPISYTDTLELMK